MKRADNVTSGNLFHIYGGTRIVERFCLFGSDAWHEIICLIENSIYPKRVYASRGTSTVLFNKVASDGAGCMDGG